MMARSSDASPTSPTTFHTSWAAFLTAAASSRAYCMYLHIPLPTGRHYVFSALSERTRAFALDRALAREPKGRAVHEIRATEICVLLNPPYLKSDVMIAERCDPWTDWHCIVYKRHSVLARTPKNMSSQWEEPALAVRAGKNPMARATHT